MKKIQRILLVALVVLGFTTSNVNAQQVFRTTSKSVIGFYEYLPPDYWSNSNKYPVVIFLHGVGERSSNTRNVNSLKSQIHEVAKLGPPAMVKKGHRFPFILISPQLKQNHGLWPSSYVKEVIDYVKSYLRVDEKRIYLTGLSLGGGGTWVTAQDYPYLFAAIAPVCGGYNSASRAAGIGNEDVAVWGFHGKRDRVVSYGKTTHMINAINRYRPSPTAKVTLYSGVYHDAWKYAYRVDHSVHRPNVYDWLLKHKNTKARGNYIPTANAGGSKSINYRSTTKTTLRGSGSDKEGSVTYRWAKIAGPSGTRLSGTSSKTLTISNLKRGTYYFRLTVKDRSGNTDSDYVRVFVR